MTYGKLYFFFILGKLYFCYTFFFILGKLYFCYTFFLYLVNYTFVNKIEIFIFFVSTWLILPVAYACLKYKAIHI